MSTPTDPVALLERRAALLSPAHRSPADAAELESVTTALRGALRGEPRVRRLELDDPGGLAHRLADLEPVNPVAGPEDLANRFAADRRVYVLEHPDLPGRPMNVVWVALWQGAADSLPAVLDPGAPTLAPGDADTAMFYSIWNAEPGLVGLGRGADLLAGAMAELGRELPGLSTFVTLSPVPSFRAAATAAGEDFGGSGPAAAERRLRGVAAHLTTFGASGRPVDPVARFHLGNGARLWRLCDGADPSPLGSQRAWGVMANYRYGPEDLAANRNALAAGHPELGDQVRDLLSPPG